MIIKNTETASNVHCVLSNLGYVKQKKYIMFNLQHNVQ